MAFNQRTGTAGRVADNVAAHEEAKHGTNAAGQPNSLLGKAADKVENRGAGASTGYGTGAGLGTGAGTRGVGTGVGTGTGHLGVGARDSQYGTGAGFRDEQLTGQRQQGVTGVQGIRTETTGQSEAFCPNPNTPGLVSFCT
jgi:hypothetical protein